MKNFTIAQIITALSILMLLPFSGMSQYNAGISAGFGIDGDLISGQSQNVPGVAPLNSFDWFKKAGPVGTLGLGFGIIDTTGASVLKAQIAAGQNIAFKKGMAFQRYSVQDGFLLLDARYGRDQFSTDKTTFAGGSKNGDNPTTWGTLPNGANSPDKADIIDTYIHLRRNGTVTTTANPSALVLAMGVSTLANTGNRYVEFELYRSRIEYNTTTGAFTNSGSSITGGHTIWTFSNTGVVTSIGDMAVTFAYGTGGVSEVGIYIWVSKTTYNSIAPTKFSFVPNEFYGSSNTFGYAKIASMNASQFNAWGSTATANTDGPAWGTSSKTLGSSTSNYSSTQYGAFDFGEVAIDLTSMGIDPALSIGDNPCAPVFTRVITKSRSSASFTSALQDFAGPYEFLDAPTVESNIATAANITCSAPSITLSPSLNSPSSVYQWSTTNGNIISINNNTVTIDKPGKYFLSAATNAGCPANTDSVTVLTDFFPPVASANVVGGLTAGNPFATAQLVGGDAVLSNVVANFGGSTGLVWDWIGPNGFSAPNTKDGFVNQEGEYRVILTEQRNGCKDTAFTTVKISSAPLPVKYAALSANSYENKFVIIKMTTEQEVNHGHFEVERSFDARTFERIAILLDGFEVGSQKRYEFKDKSPLLVERGTVYYRLKQLDKDGNFTYTNVMQVKFGVKNKVLISAAPNPFIESLTIQFNSTERGVAQINIINALGNSVMIKNSGAETGFNSILVNNLSNLQKGYYIARVIVNGIVIGSQKLIKK